MELDYSNEGLQGVFNSTGTGDSRYPSYVWPGFVFVLSKDALIDAMDKNNERTNNKGNLLFCYILISFFCICLKKGANLINPTPDLFTSTRKHV